MNEEQLILGERYQLEEIIGRGGMAEVWRARDMRLGRPVAVKRLRVDLATDTTFQARFNREAQAAAGLNHPNIVSVYDTGDQPDPMSGVAVPYIVMELVQGQTLRDLLRSGTEISPTTAFGYVQGVLEALAYSHDKGIIHRDIKPANVMLTDGGQIKVMDFGIARAVADTSATMTQTAAIIGTAQYLSPEQARGEAVDARSDLYSTGCLLYELLTARPPFVGDSPVSVAYQHVRERPKPPSTFNAAISEAMDTVTLKALAKNPEDRYQSAKQMRDDIVRVLGGDPVTAVLPAVESTPTEVLEAPTRIVPAPAAATTAVLNTRPSRALDPVAEDDYEDDYDYEEATGTMVAQEPPRRGPSAASIVLIVLTVILLAALGFFVWRLATPDPKANMVEVPTVRGFQEEAAKSALSNARLVTKVAQQEGPAETKGQVIDQDPAGGQQVQVGSTVTITINTGPPTVKIPEGLVGKSESEARAILRTAGFTNVVALKAPADKEPADAAADSVVEISPAAGSPIATDSQVTLYVATGESRLPDVAGLTLAEATERLNAAGFSQIRTEEVTVTDPSHVGRVVSQIPAAGDVARRTNLVTLRIGKAAPTPTPTPTPTPEPTQPSPTPSPARSPR